MDFATHDMAPARQRGPLRLESIRGYLSRDLKTRTVSPKSQYARLGMNQKLQPPADGDRREDEGLAAHAEDAAEAAQAVEEKCQAKGRQPEDCRPLKSSK